MSDASENDVPTPPQDDDAGTRRSPAPRPRQAGAGAAAAGNGSVWLNYNPADYKTLNISAEVQDLFKHITK